MEDKVELQIMSLKDLFNWRLNIPSYQRIYCWAEKNVVQLLEDIQSLKKEYRLGTIILQKKANSEYDVIDGQQRLVTLSLILLELNDNSSPLLEKSFYSEEAYKYVAYNKYIIKNYLSRFSGRFNVEYIKDHLTFNVLVLKDGSLDLAYTFFSNENSRGCPLTDFDLLKAHHLRFVQIEEQAKHLSTLWDRMLLEEQDVSDKYEKSYERSLGLYIFRLRKWLNFEDWDENEKYKVKNEYEAARIYDEIPPFGEKFEYKEPIQGGTHFFAYVNRFKERYKTFSQTNEFKIIHSKMIGETHIWFRDVIEALMFAYYLKFGVDYLSEALTLIIKVVSQTRYDYYRIYKETIFETVKESKIVMEIERATSPTFFIAALKYKVELLPKMVESDFKGIRLRYSRIADDIIKDLGKTYMLKSFEA